MFTPVRTAPQEIIPRGNDQPHGHGHQGSQIVRIASTLSACKIDTTANVLPIIPEAQKAGVRAVRKLANALNAGGIATAREGGSDGKRARSDSSKPRNGEEATAIRFAGRNREREASNGWRWGLAHGPRLVDRLWILSCSRNRLGHCDVDPTLIQLR
jgi:hypothetical protein